mmetsp:Transcript_12677/g.35061  ORF Transcript_12677/g.35061 Transcript_12677/m.35061 type:complete len:110 (-) Transcript_12677:220-549(-)
MVYLENWEEFVAAAQCLFVKSPDKTRYLLKYRGSQGKLILKVTDDRVCIKFRTDDAAYLGKVAKFNERFCRWAVEQNVETLEFLDPEDPAEALTGARVAPKKATKKRKS